MIVLLLLSGQTSKAQYTKLLKGQASHYDTAVAIRIDIYRMESKRLKYGAKLIDSLTANVVSVSKELSLSDSLGTVKDVELVKYKKVLHVKDSINLQLNTLNESYNKIANEAISKNKWHKDPKTWALTALLTILIIKN